MVKALISKTFRGMLGDKRYYQFARFLWHDSRRDPAGNNMALNGEMKLLSALLDLSRSVEDPIFMDIGCNVGEYAEEILNRAKRIRFSDSLRLFCFEPNPACVEKIESRLKEHTMRERTVIVPKIVTNQLGEAEFFITGDTAGTSSLKIDLTAQKAQKEIRAECVTLDEFCTKEGIADIFFAKIDTEGNDANVIQGGISLLQEDRIKFLQFEYNHRWITFRYYLKDIFEIVQPLGYQVGKVTGEGLVVYKRWHYELEAFVEGNYLIGKDFGEIGLPLFYDHSGSYMSAQEDREVD